MAKTKEPSPIVFIAIFLFLAAGGYWYFLLRQPAPSENTLVPNPAPPAATGAAFAPPATIPNGTTVRIDGSTSMVTFNQNLKRSFEGKFPGTNVATTANGTDKGIQALVAGSVDLAAISRPLTPAERGQGLVALPFATDQIAVVVGKNNPFKGGLTSDQVDDIFQGETTDWVSVGGPQQQIRVINRPAASGTHQVFKELVLKGGNFGTTPNITTLPRDETTGLLRELKTNGIGYATYAQVANQQTVRVVPIDGIAPGTPNYPFQRQLYYVYKKPPSPAVKAFLGYATSTPGRQAAASGN